MVATNQKVSIEELVADENSAYVIEVKSRKNNQLVFAPTRQRLRGCWSFDRVAGRFSHDAMKAIARETSEINGMRVMVHVRRKVCTIYDPLKETELGQELWQKIEPIINQYRDRFQTGTRLEDATVIEDCSEDTMKTWLYYMRRAIDSGHAIAVGAQLPELRDFDTKIPGRVEVAQLANTSYRTPEDREKARWKHVVEGKSGGKE